MGHFRSFKALLESGSLSQLYGSSGGHFRSFIPKFRQSAFARTFAQHSRAATHASSRHISAKYAFQKPRFGDMMVVSTIYTHGGRQVHPLAVDSDPVKMLYPHRDGSSEA